MPQLSRRIGTRARHERAVTTYRITFLVSVYGRTGLRNLASGVLPQGPKHAGGDRAAVGALLTAYIVCILYFVYY